VNHKRVARLMPQMGMEAIDAKPHLRQATAGQTIDPYWLRGVKVARVNHVWSTAITSMRFHQGFVSRVAVMDWCRRYVLRWALSVTLDGQFGREALPQALCQGRRPEMFNTDQGGQCTSKDFTPLLAHEGMRISMDGHGWARARIGPCLRCASLADSHV
jgi:putative transposase